MQVVFLSNYMTPHQQPFSEEMFRLLGSQYMFIQTVPMEKSRIDLGWPEYRNLSYVFEYCPNMDTIIKNCDLLIVGGIRPGKWVAMRRNKVVFWYEERIYKTGMWKALSPKGFYYNIWKDHITPRNPNVYMLAASAYLPTDMNLFHLYHKKMLKWGYFPKLRKYDSIDRIIYEKGEKINLLWAGRFIDWKRPELAIDAAMHLEKRKIDYTLSFIGTGPLEEKLKLKVKSLGLNNKIHFLGKMNPDDVRDCMEKSTIFLATSNYQEGWGAVINEAMNSACVVIASHAMGATPYLIRHRENGLVFEMNSTDDLFNCLDVVIMDKEYRVTLAKNAYASILDLWNPYNAAHSIIDAYNYIVRGIGKLPDEGPCSKANVVSQKRMYSLIRGE